MPQFANGSFIPKRLLWLRGAVERAWRALPNERQTELNKNLIADVIVRSAAEGERDPGLLSDLALATLCLEARHGAL